MELELLAKDIMTRDPLMVNEDQSVGELVGLFHHYQISGAPVCNDEGHLVGVVSLRDVTFTALRPIGDENPEPLSGYHVHGKMNRGHQPVPFEWHLDHDLTVADIMTPVVFTVEVTASIVEIAETMLKGKIHRLVVVENERVVGIVTSGDLLEVIRQKAQATPPGTSR